MSTLIERMETGVPGLDDLMEGGVPKGSSLLIAGSSGTGKSILATQIVYNRLKAGDNVLLMSLERSTKGIYQQASQFGWSLEEYALDGRLMVLQFEN